MPMSTQVRRGYITPYYAVDCSDESTIANFLTNLQRAWLLQPDWAEGKDLKITDLGSEMSSKILSHIQQPPAEELTITGEPDREDVHTPLREALYWQWNHVFFNIANFLSEVNCNTGVHACPSHQPLEARFPETGEEGEMATVLEFSVGKHMLLGVTFVEPGIRVKIGIRNEKEKSTQAHEDNETDDEEAETDEDEADGEGEGEEAGEDEEDSDEDEEESDEDEDDEDEEESEEDEDEGDEDKEEIGEKAEKDNEKSEAEAESPDSCTIDATEAGPMYIGKSVYWIKASHRVSIQVPRQAAKAGKLACVFVASPYQKNFFHCNNDEHMRLHELYDDSDRAEDLKGSRFVCVGSMPGRGEWRTANDLCAEVNSIALMLHEESKDRAEQ